MDIEGISAIRPFLPYQTVFEKEKSESFNKLTFSADNAGSCFQTQTNLKLIYIQFFFCFFFVETLMPPPVTVGMDRLASNGYPIPCSSIPMCCLIR